MEKKSIIEILVSRIKIADRYVSKHPKKDKPKLSYFFVSTKVVQYKDGAGVMREAIVGTTYRKPKEM